MKSIQFLLTILALIFASESYAAYCNDLDKKSSAYQTCMLRTENDDRDYKKEQEEKRKKDIEATKIRNENFTNYQKEHDNLMALSDVIVAEKNTMRTMGLNKGIDDCANVLSQYAIYTLSACKQGVIVLLAVNQSSLVQEFSKDIQNKQVDSMYVGGSEVIGNANKYTLHQQKKGVALYIDVSDTPDILKSILEKMGKKGAIEFFLGTGSKSFRYMLDNYHHLSKSFPSARHSYSILFVSGN
jgi:hypothetical protein